MICRLCLKDRKETLEIFEGSGLQLEVAIMVGKYFWFEPKSDDPISTSICTSCIDSICAFHHFYTEVEEAHRLLNERFTLKGSSRKEGSQRKQNTCQEVLKTASTPQKAKEQSSKNPVEEVELVPEEPKKQILEEGTTNAKDTKVEKTSTFQQPSPRRSKRSLVILKTIKSETKDIQFAQGSNVKKKNDDCDSVDEDFSSSEEFTLPDAEQEKEEPPPTKRSRGRPPKAKTAKLDKAEQRRLAETKIAKYITLSCDLCALGYAKFNELCRHMEEVHKVRGYVMCCEKKLFRFSMLADHAERHENPQYFSCLECDKVFASKECLRNHRLLKHLPEEAKVHECEQCHMKFAKAYLLEQHRVKHEERKHICDICQRGFPAASYLKSHQKLKHSESGEMCEICSKVIPGRAAFKRHKLMHQGISEPKVQCHKCGSWHKDKYGLQKHMRRHNETGELHICNICFKKAPNRSALMSHQRYVHKSERVFACNVCSKAFKKPLNLKEHMATHTGEVLYKCSHCPKTFNSNANMHSHRKKAHPKEFEETRRKRQQMASGRPHDTSQGPNDAAASTTSEEPKKSPKILTLRTGDNGETQKIQIVTTQECLDADDEEFGDDSMVFTLEQAP